MSRRQRIGVTGAAVEEYLGAMTFGGYKVHMTTLTREAREDGESSQKQSMAHATETPSSRRRLIFVNRYFFPDISATSQILSDLARALVASRYELHVICSGQLYADARACLASEELWQGVHIHRCWSTRFGRGRLIGRAIDYLSFYASATLMMLRRARHDDLLVAMTDPPMISVCAAIAAKLRGATLINWLHDIFPEVASSLDMRLPFGVASVLRSLRNWSLRVAGRNIVLGHRMHTFVNGQGIPTERQRVIENWADQAVAPLPTSASALRRSLDLADGTFVVQYSGNLGRAHDHETLLAAAEQLRPEAGWCFLFVGGGIGMGMVRAGAERRGLTSMRFLPYQPREHLGDSLAAGDVHLACLLPSLEGLIVPSKLYGVLAAGRPVVLIGDLDGEQARVVRAHDCGVAVASGDGASLAQALRRIRLDPEWRDAAGQRARRLHEQRYAFEHAVGKWRSVLEQAPLKEAAD